MRHAQSESSFQGKDYDKPLSDFGYLQLKQVTEYLRREKYAIDVILHSPLKRTSQCAKFIKESQVQAQVLGLEALGDRFDSYHVTNKLKDQSDDCILIIGHEPSLSLYSSNLLSKYHPFKFKTATCLVMNFKNEFTMGAGNYLDLFISNQS